MGFFDVIKAALGICETQPFNPDRWELIDSRLQINLAGVPSKGEWATYFKGKGLITPIFLMRTSDGRFFSFKNKCPHDGRKLDRIRGKNMLKCCSLRQSTFDLHGNIVSGPAKHHLEAFQVESLKDRVAIVLPREAWIDWTLE